MEWKEKDGYVECKLVFKLRCVKRADGSYIPILRNDQGLLLDSGWPFKRLKMCKKACLHIVKKWVNNNIIKEEI